MADASADRSVEEFKLRFCHPELIEDCRDTLVSMFRQGTNPPQPASLDPATLSYLRLYEETHDAADADAKLEAWQGYVEHEARHGNLDALDLETVYARNDLWANFDTLPTMDAIGLMNDLWQLSKRACEEIRGSAYYCLAIHTACLDADQQDWLLCPGPLMLLTSASDLGCAEASMELSRMLTSGGLLEPNLPLAHRYHVRAAHDGDASAWTYVAMDYLLGRGTPRDPDRMIDALMSGAAAGDYSSCVSLGDLFSTGCPGSRLAPVPDMRLANEYYSAAYEIETEGAQMESTETEGVEAGERNHDVPAADRTKSLAYVGMMFTQAALDMDGDGGDDDDAAC